MPANDALLPVDAMSEGGSLPSIDQPLETPSEMFFLADCLRQHFLQGIPHATAVLDPILNSLRNRYATSTTVSEGRLGALMDEVASTWLLVEALFDPEFSAVEVAPEASVRDVCRWFAEHPEGNHLTRALSWLQLELRKGVYLEELNSTTPERIYAHPRDIFSAQSQNQAANCEMLFKQCIKYWIAGMRSKAESVLVAARRSHLAAPLYSHFLPVLQLVSAAGKDVYWHSFTDYQREMLQLRYPEEVNGSHKRDAEWRGLRQWNDSHYGTGNQYVVQDQACTFKARQASARGLSHEYAFYSLMNGKKRRDDVLCSSSWRSQIYSDICCRLKQLFEEDYLSGLPPYQNLMELDGGLTHRADRDVYQQLGDALANVAQRVGESQLELHASFLSAASLHRTQHDFEEFFRTLQASLILRDEANLLSEFRDTLLRLVQEIEHAYDPNPDTVCKKIWVLTFANFIVYLINTHKLRKRQMSPAQLMVLDKVLECVLRMVESEESFLLVPFYARHLRTDGLTRWIHRALRRCSEVPIINIRHFFAEVQFWLEGWTELQQHNFHRPDDPEGHRITLTEIVLANAEEMYSDLTFTKQQREAALTWLQICGEMSEGTAETRQHTRNLLFSFYSELAFTEFDAALKIADLVPAFVENGIPDPVAAPHEDVSQLDVAFWAQYCKIRQDCSAFIEAAESESETEITAEQGEDIVMAENEDLSALKRQLIDAGIAVYWKAMNDIMEAKFFFEPLFLPKHQERHKIEFVVGKNLEGEEGMGPFSPADLPAMNATNEKFINELLACHEDIAACCSSNMPLPRYFTIRLEFRREALITPLIPIVASYMKGQRVGMPAVSIAQLSAPLLIRKHLANIRAKSALFRDLIHIQSILFKSAASVPAVAQMEDCFLYLLSRRCEIFEEEHVLDAHEISELMQDRSETLIELHIQHQLM